MQDNAVGRTWETGCFNESQAGHILGGISERLFGHLSMQEQVQSCAGSSFPLRVTSGTI